MAHLVWALAVLQGIPADTWRLVLPKLAMLAPASFSHPDLLLIYEAYLLLDASCAPLALEM